MRLLLAAALFFGGIVFTGQGIAQESGAAPTVLVIDASNSMWGRIDGKPKMQIAKDAVSTLVDTLPKNVRLGLVAYGHRRAGDCGDIETALSVGPVDKRKVQTVTDRLTPRGKTPITASLKAAAGLLEASKPGTVIIVTDGIETCQGDPCALAEELKRKNASFVAHVIGFDVSAVERSKLSCIADRTGGTFVAASDAAELGQALKTTVQAKPRTAVTTRSIALEATENGRPFPMAQFTIARSGEAGSLAEGISGPVALSPGRYRVSAIAGTRTGRSEVEVTKNSPDKIVIALSGDLPKASLKPAKTTISATGALDVGWTGPDENGDYIAVARTNGEALETRHYSYTRDGNPLKIRAPGEPGDYELRYVSDVNGAILAQAKITVTPVTATLNAPDKGQSGSEIAVAFAGPNAPEDWVGLARIGSDANTYEAGAWTYADSGSPARLRLPAEAGTYEIRYVSGLDPQILAARKVEVTAASASVAAPARAMAGSVIKVGFKGSGGGDTFIGIVKKGSEAGSWIGGAYERPDGEQVSLHVPGEPGAYEVRFVLEANGTYRILASAPLAVEPAMASVTAPDRVKRGTPVAVSFTGPDGGGSFVAIAPAGSGPDAYTDFRYASDSGTETLHAPDEAGAYEVRYVMAAPGDTGSMVIARKPLRVD